MAEFDPVALFATLVDHGVRFVVIGGVAARLRGAPLLTEDVDITPDPSESNLRSLAAALAALDGRLRTPDEPDGVEFPLDAAMLATSRSWTLVTRYGDLDLVFEPAGTAGYRDVHRDAEDVVVGRDPEVVVRVASLVDIIRSKEAAGRAKDRAALPLLRRTLEERGDSAR